MKPDVYIKTPAPTVGRIVHLSWSGRRLPAIVVAVDLDGKASVRSLDEHQITVFWAEQAQETPESAAKLNNMDTPHMTWSWPPRT